MVFDSPRVGDRGRNTAHNVTDAPTTEIISLETQALAATPDTVFILTVVIVVSVAIVVVIVLLLWLLLLL